VKGILRLDDAQRAHECGAEGSSSRHTAVGTSTPPPAPIAVLPAIADKLSKRMAILADSGIRRGSDIAKYLASGAQAVMLGRALLYGTAGVASRAPRTCLPSSRTS
jgi:L-lactate dehydrogenase (cytochrome)